jgi:transcription termination factor NusB
MLTVVNLTDNLRKNIEAKLQRIYEINLKIESLRSEKELIIIDAYHECDLLNAAISDPEYKEQIVDSVINKHKEQINFVRNLMDRVN